MQKRRILTAIATGAVLINALAPMAFADTTLGISGNGAYSDSQVKVDNQSSTNVVQNNNANVTNNVNTNLSTGGNKANYNTGGDVLINTGDASSKVDISTIVNKNVANVQNMNNNNTSVDVSGNGYASTNSAKVDNSSSTNLSQDNYARINNNVNTAENTGYNDAKGNTGGNTTVVTGNARSDVAISNAANSNSAYVGGGNGSGGMADVKISGNGAYSDNSVSLQNNPSIRVAQDNYADIKNKVNSDLTTGFNDANYNTGGNVILATGDAKSGVGIDNLANFNEADLGGNGYLFDVNAKVAGNGYDSLNKLNADFGAKTKALQNSNAYLDNYVDPLMQTGYNDANKNTGPVYGDPIDVFTGNAYSDSYLNNASNENVYSQGGGYKLPDGSSLSFNFDLGGLMQFMHLM